LEGNVDGYMSKNSALHFIPILTLIIIGLMVFLPRLDPEKERYTSFQTAYDGLIVITVLFLMTLYGVTLLWALGIKIPMNSLMACMFGLFFIGIGFFFGVVKKTWFVGIRTPWTLLSERVWDKTHQKGSWLFIASGIISFGGIIYPKYAYLFIFVPIVITSIFLFIYSYVLYSKETSEKDKTT
jgi:uncharacterized membrane protein